MIREIKFRGITKNSNMLVYGNLVKSSKDECSIIRITEFNPIHQTSQHWNIYAPAFSVKPETVGQFTGLTDKNGTEVYEGDFIKIDGSNKILQVVFKKGCFYSVNKSPGTQYRLGGWEENTFEIIGNIHENPELLNQ